MNQEELLLTLLEGELFILKYFIKVFLALPPNNVFIKITPITPIDVNTYFYECWKKTSIYILQREVQLG